jgi:hypothetical protein
MSVCNEQMLSPEGKVCSGLCGNAERLAETTSSRQCRRNIIDDPVDWMGRKHDFVECVPARCAYFVSL